MRLHSIKLTNYIGIYNGLGLKTISIDFTRCINKVTIIKGDNGSGKSTIFNALTPFSDTNNNFIPNEEAKKQIAYIMDSGDVIEITYIHPIDRRTKCMIYKINPMDGSRIDLNPNHNMIEAKEMIKTLFDFDPQYIALSQLSSNNRGLADKKPAERKKLINSMVESIYSYNEIYKKLSKKSSSIKSMITSINSKISSIGDISATQARIKQLEEEIGQLEDTKNLILYKVGKIKGKLEDIHIDERGKYELDNSIRDLKINLDRYIEKGMENITYDYISTTLKNYEKEKSNVESEIRELNSAIESTSNFMVSINSDITEVEAKLNVFENVGSIEHLKASIEKDEEDLQIMKHDLDTIYDNMMSISIIDNIDNIKMVTEKINSIIANLSDLINNTDTYCKGSLAVKKVLFGVKYKSFRTDISILYKQLTELELVIEKQNTYREMANGYENIPITCSDENRTKCPFVSSIVEAKKKCIFDKEYNKILKTIEDTKTNIEYAKSNNEMQDILDKIEEYTTSLVNTCIENIDIIKYINFLTGSDLTKNTCIDAIISVGTPLTLNLEIINDLKNLETMIATVSARLEESKQQYSKISQNLEMYNLLKEQYSSLENKYFMYKEEIDKYRTLLEEKKYGLESINRSIIDNTKLKEDKTNYLEYKQMYDQALIKKKDIDDKYNEVKSLTSNLNELHIKVKSISNTTTKLTDEMNKLKYSIVLYNDYVKEYKEFSDKYNTIETVRKYSSPTTGIQTVYMSMYLNDILVMSNKLLNMLFNGEYVIYPFIVNDTEFRIPCSGSGLMNDDISSMSSAQIAMISMIISFVLLKKSSSIYNIIKMDEIDGPLDTVNRLKFSELLLRIMDILNSQQCIMISHNSELGLNNCDVILLKNSDPSLKLEGNIIYQFREEY